MSDLLQQLNLQPIGDVTKALSLTQPWATLVATGHKAWETRSWSTKYRGWLAIHASKGFPKPCRELCLEGAFRRVLRQHDYIGSVGLPLGQVLCIAYLSDCVSTNVWTPDKDSDEYAFGDYSPNRFAWKFDAVVGVAPFPVKGALSIWQLPNPITEENRNGKD